MLSDYVISIYGVDILKNQICIFSFPTNWPTVGIFLKDIVSILGPSSKDIHVITGGKVPSEGFGSAKIHYIGSGIKFQHAKNVFIQLINSLIWAISIIKYQFKMLMLVYELRDCDKFIFYWGYFYQLPLAMCRLLKKDSYLFLTNPDNIGLKYTWLSKLLGQIFRNINYKLVKYLVPESPALAKYWSGHYKKIRLYGARFVPEQYFSKILKSYRKRNNIVGYVGRLEMHKGVLNFIEATKIVNQKYPNIEYLIVGTGPLKDIVTDKIKNVPHICYKPWVDRNNVANILSELKLLILPTESEGLPTIAIESLACGTPLIATPIGGLIDLIQDGKTGFIIRNNKPHEIAQGIIRALNSNLDEISCNAYKLAIDKYSLNAAIDRYYNILN